MSSLFDLPFDEPGPEPPAPSPVRRVLTVAELTEHIRMFLEERFFEVWVEGEISNSRHWNTGHFYFTLKDASAQIKGVVFRSALRYLRFKPHDGLRVVARGRVTVYDPKGEYQIVCEHLEPAGLGALQLAFDQLRQRLGSEGLFDQSRKRPLPVLPRKIGVVTSLDGAAVRDIVQVLRRRYPNVHIVIRPTRVQGEGAALDIARALKAIGRVRDVDVVIVGRGGGSLEDLWAFNEEGVARAIAACPVPVISAVGHETDVTIADFAADLRAPTPSAAAELVVARKDDFNARITRLAGRVQSALHRRQHPLEKRFSVLEATPRDARQPRAGDVGGARPIAPARIAFTSARGQTRLCRPARPRRRAGTARRRADPRAAARDRRTPCDPRSSHERAPDQARDIRSPSTSQRDSHPADGGKRSPRTRDGRAAVRGRDPAAGNCGPPGHTQPPGRPRARLRGVLERRPHDDRSRCRKSASR
jgi:exodeoxyribonuclease VII large subunit